MCSHCVNTSNRAMCAEYISPENFFVVDISVRSPRSLFIFIIHESMYGIKASKKFSFNFETKMTVQDQRSFSRLFFLGGIL